MLDSGLFIERCPHDSENPYTMVNTALIRDERLHPTTRWILISLLSNKSGWKINTKQFVSSLKPHGYGRDKVLKFFKQACEVGYMKKEVYFVNGLKRTKYILSERPKFKESLPRTAHQGPDHPAPEEQGHKKEHTSSYEEVKKEHIDKTISHRSEVKKTLKSSSTPSADASELALYFISKIREKKKDFKVKNEQKWALEIEKMLRIDGRSVSKAKEIIDWLSNQPKHFTYIQSAEKLRSQFDAQEMRMDAYHHDKIISRNRDYCILISKQYPTQFKDLAWDAKMVKNMQTGKGLLLDCEHEEFKSDVNRLFGGYDG